MEKEAVVRFLIGIVILAALVFGAFRLYLYLNPLLGNDILVTIKSENNNLFLSHGEKAKVAFEIHASANPFCKAQCETNFIDLSKDEVLDKNIFNMILP